MNTVLIVEQDEGIREVLRRSLYQQGYGAAFVGADPRELEDTASSLQPWLVVGESDSALRMGSAPGRSSEQQFDVVSRPRSTMELLIAVKLASRRAEATPRSEPHK